MLIKVKELFFDKAPQIVESLQEPDKDIDPVNWYCSERWQYVNEK